MTNAEKNDRIKPWVNPEERITLDFSDEKGFNAEVLDSDPNVVTLSIQTVFPHYKQEVVVPLSAVELQEDPQHYTRDPDHPIQSRLKLTVNKKRSQITSYP